MTEARFVYDQYATHQPILYEALLRSEGPVIEFGAGYGSTPMLHRVCEEQGRALLTIENDRGWLDLFGEYATDWHQMILVEDWDTILTDPYNRLITTQSYSVAFVDQAPWEARALTIRALKDTAHFIVLHDCDYFPEHGLFGENLEGLSGPTYRGQRTYDDVFKYYQEFFPLQPWPYPRTGPPTLLGSNFEPCDWEIDFREYVTKEVMF